MSEPVGGFGAGDSGTVGTSDGTASIPSGGTAEGQASTGTVGGTSDGINPKWNPVLDKIPSQMHPLVTPALREWDTNYRNLQQEYAPWKQIVESNKGLTPQHVNNAIQLMTMLNSNPQEFYRRLGNELGISPAQAQQVVQEELEENYGDEQPQVQLPPEVQQQLDALQQQNMQLLQFQQQQQYTQQVSSYEQQIDAEVKQVLKTNPNANVQDLMQRYLAQIERNEQPSVQKAYQEQQAFLQSQIAAMGLQMPAPNVIPPGGGMPSTQQQVKTTTSDDRTRAVGNLLAMRQRTGQ